MTRRFALFTAGVSTGLLVAGLALMVGLGKIRKALSL